jgi:hypothetical protein
MSKMRKISFVAYTWEQYEAQGDGYAEVGTWWKQNAASLPGDYDNSYSSWTSWYKEKYYGEWNNSHARPSSVIDILNKEKGSGASNSSGRIDRVREMLGGIPSESGGTQSRPQGGSNNYRRLIGSNLNANVDKTSDAVKAFLAALGTLAKERGHERPFVTSAFRSSRSQVRAMAENWRRKGADETVSDAEAVNHLQFHGPQIIAQIRQHTNKPLNKGLVYLFDLYQDKEMVIGINDIFVQLGSNRAGVKAGTEFWDSLGRPKSSHLADPATSVDLRLTKGIKELLDEIDASNQFTLKILPEGDHFHVNVRA